MKFNFGVNDKKIKTICCENCGKEFEISIQSGVIDDRRRNEAKAIVESDKFFKYKCPHCGKYTTHIHSFCYVHNSYILQGAEYGQWVIKLVDSKEEAMEYAKYIDEVRKNSTYKDEWASYRVRVVWNYKDFFEKLLCVISLDDDRIIELMKEDYRKKLELDSFRRVECVNLIRIIEPITELCLQYMFDDDSDEYIEIEYDNYKEALDEIKSTKIMETDDDIIVNQDMYKNGDYLTDKYKPIHRR